MSKKYEKQKTKNMSDTYLYCLKSNIPQAKEY